MPKANADTGDAILVELTAIKRLLVFSLLKSGATQGEVAAALSVDQSQVSRMFPAATGSKSRRPKSKRR